MAQKFLEQLLRNENTVQKDEHDGKCMICLESYGVLSSSTGAMEAPIRLPCKHIVGSMCIGKWLRDNNSCPLCRATFFPAQPRPYLEHGIMMNDEESMEHGFRVSTNDEIRISLGPDTTDEQRAYLQDRIMQVMMSARDPVLGGGAGPAEVIHLILQSHRLDLHRDISNTAQHVSRSLSMRLEEVDLPEQVHPSDRNAVLSIYIATHLLNQNVNLTDLCAGRLVNEDDIRSAWHQIYPHRMELINTVILSYLVSGHTDRIEAFLPTPESEFSNMIRAGTTHPRLSQTVGDDDLYEDIMELNNHLAVKMDDYTENVGLDEYTMGDEAAVRAYIACHLLGVKISYSDIARIYHVRERTLRQVYAYVFTQRSNFIRWDIAMDMGERSIGRILDVLPALNWPSTA